jgi:hypothetical protein
MMSKNSATDRSITVARRAQLIQRVLVDGWSPAQVAKSCGVEERQVARWVADYRRRGMASLRADIVDERLYRRWAGRARTMLARGFGIVWHGVAPGTCVVLPSTRDDERRRR